MAEGTLKIDPQGLTTASGNYTTEAGKFNTTVDELKQALIDVLNVWDDAAKPEWEKKVGEVCDSLGAVSELLTGNAEALNQIADVAQKSEQSVATGVAGL